jgi:hypothetical protein
MNDEDRRHVHDAQQEPGIPFQRPRQHHPIAEQEAKCGEDADQEDVDQPAGWRCLSPGHQPDLCGIHPAVRVAIDNGDFVSGTGVKDLANQTGHSRERNAIDGEDIVFGMHAGAARLGQGLHQKSGAVGVVKRQPCAVGIEEAVEGCSRVGYIKEHGTRNQDGQQQIRKFGEVGLHGPNMSIFKCFRRHGSRPQGASGG